MFDDIAEAKGWTPKQIAEETGINLRTIERYISQKYKERKHLNDNLSLNVQMQPP